MLKVGRAECSREKNHARTQIFIYEILLGLSESAYPDKTSSRAQLVTLNPARINIYFKLPNSVLVDASLRTALPQTVNIVRVMMYGLWSL